MSDLVTDQWVQIKLGDVGSFSTSSVNKKSIANELPVKLVNYMDVYRNNGIGRDFNFSETTAKENQVYVNNLLKGDVLFTPSSETPGDIGHAAVITEDLKDTVYSYHLVRYRPDHTKTKLDINFCKYVFSEKNVLKEFARRSKGSTRFTISKADFEATQIMIPISLPVQGRIAEILDANEILIKQTEQIISQTRLLKKSLLKELFSTGLRSTPMKNTNEFGFVPAHWQIKPLGEISRFIDYRGKTPKKTTEGIPLITAKNVRQGYISKTPCEYISITDYPGWMTRGIPNKGDVVITTEAPLGNVAQIDTDQKVAFAQRVIILQTEISSTFLKYMLSTKVTQNHIDTLASGGTVKGIKSSLLKTVPILIPPTEEQERIANILTSIDKKITVNEALLRKQKNLMLALKQDLLTGKVQVQGAKK